MNARKRSFAAIGETCPDVDRAINDAREQIERDLLSEMTSLESVIKRKATEPLREALVEAYAEIERLEYEVGEANDRISALEEELRDATAVRVS